MQKNRLCSGAQSSFLLPWIVSLSLVIQGTGIAAFASKPKYGPEITLLSTYNQPIRVNPSPDYWALSPYYIAQHNSRACSLASVVMVLNALRPQSKLTADDELFTQKSIQKLVNDKTWDRGLGEGGKGVSLQQLGTLVEKSLKVAKLDGFSVRVRHVEDSSETTIESIRKDLVENEKSANTMMISNFLQGVYTGDAMTGHISPVAAYDAKKDRVLVMDVDREWYEPYWVSTKTFVAGMATQDKTAGRFRGYVLIEPKKP